jgi:hypothetical protein
MQSGNYNINQLSNHLFWDTDIANIDLSISDKFIVHRVLEYGTIDDWKLITKIYGLPKIKEIALSLRTLDDVTLSFLCTLFHLKKTDFRCYRLKQSTHSSWNY